MTGRSEGYIDVGDGRVWYENSGTGDRTLLRSPYDDALRSAAVTLAANRSAEEGGRLVRIA